MRLKLTLHRQGGVPVDIVIKTDSTATAADVARHVATADPTRSTPVAEGDVVTLAVAPPTGDRLVPLQPDVPIGEAPIGSGFAASIVNYGPDYAAAGQRDVVGVLVATSGALAGQEFPISAGHVFLGRDAVNDVVLSDPMVSKRHARLEVGTHIEVVDLNSANGVLVDGIAVQRVRVEEGEPFVIGGTTLVLRLARTFDGSATEDPIIERGGGLLFNRSPRVEVRYPGTLFKVPRLPTEKIGRMFPWPILIAPILMGMALYALNGNPRSLLMIVMTPLMAFGNIINQAAQSKKGENHEFLLFERQYEQLEEDFFRGKPEEERARNAEAPPVAEVFDHAMRLGPMLWTRRPEHWNFLGLRLGSCRLPARNRIDDAEAPDGLPDFIDRVDRLRERYAFVDDVPVFDTFADAGSIGIAGPQGPVADTMRGIAVQLFGLHAPNDLVAVAFTDSAWTPELEWLKWMPHTSSERSPFQDMALADSAPTAAALLSSLEEYVSRAASAGSGEPRGPFKEDWNPLLYGTDVARAATEHKSTPPISVVVFVSSDAPVDRGRLTEVLERGADHGVHAVFVSPTVESLPAVCRSYIDVTTGLEDAQVGLVRNGENFEHVRVEGVSDAYMQMLARRLAPVVDASTAVHDSSDIPSAVMFLQLVDPAIAEDPQVVIERWRQNNTIVDRTPAPRPRLKKSGTLRAIIGQGPSDAMALDLRTQGPHALVGGTTGAGKSEFLQAWVLGMAAAHSPDRVTFLFVDYKGGSAFADCVELPHCVGLVTDLSPHLVRRALTSLRAELQHREHLLNRKKAKDLLELEKRQDPECPPALVLVIDEFAALASEMPDFVDGVVDIAQRGRSLGIHLIMATQRPAGVIKDNLRANTNLRIALRMADEADSRDVVDDGIASTFSASIPGRAIAKTGPGRLVPFQSAYAGGWTTDDDSVAAEVRVAELRFGSSAEWEPDRPAESDSHLEDLGPNDQKRIVSTLIRAADKAALMRPRRPWLDDLAPLVDLRDLPNEGDTRIPLALLDVPEKQLQQPGVFNPDRDGSLVIYGTSGSGKSTLLKTIGTAAGMRPDRGRVQVYCLDFASGALGALSALPHVGSVVDGADVERIQRLLRTLDGEMDRRAAAFSAASAASVQEYRELVDPRMPRILLLIDNYPEFKKDWEVAPGRGPFYRIFMRILGEGRTLGVHTVITADRGNAVPSAVAANISRRVVLRMGDPSQYMLLGTPRDVLDDQSAPGRAIVDGHEAQIAVLGGTMNVVEQTKALAVLGDELRKAGVRDLPEIGALPTMVPVDEMPAQVDGMPVFGVADDTLAPHGFEPIGSFVISGPPASGRTNALKALVVAMERFDPNVRMYHFGSRRAELKDFRPWVRSATKAEDEKELAAELAELVVSDAPGGGRIMIVIEDIPHLADGPADRPMRALLQAMNNSDHILIGEAEITRASGSIGVLGEWKTGRQGIVLKPDTYDGEGIFKTPFGRVKRADFPVGRGIFVQAGRAVTMQIPFVPEAPSDGQR
ncbi:MULTISPECIES: FtsK/SpoIIIE domain-containing protein [unclassified Microbacterium]|uniref:FtsK/SpoIIIE domain-containing protein n=1 Tax=unclassified Microbacterium TaxID=2609290 RepID=UPI000EA8C472|nr:MULTISPECIES: FtsK/SpoIIIE domain-containing protein [unclassified Microbacterium]MBT2484532.1 FHA domain-containing protein [Microbacterium sp. ISL-108]RKN67434.1 FHA domain-containing protein [Microbacterium sp. CGR2]